MTNSNTPNDEIAEALAGIRNRLDTLSSINAENILIPGGPQEQYHQIVEEAYAALGLIETQVDELRAELEFQHKRLDEARDEALRAAAHQEQEQQHRQPIDVDPSDLAERAHEDWANEE